MKIAVLGTGMAGRTLASRLAGLGHDVVIGSRDVATLECPVAASGGGLARPRSPASLAFPVQHRDRPCIVDGGGCMAAWRKAELERIAGADDLHIAPFRDDGMTYGMPTWIRSVVAEHALYVRAYKGQASRWYGAALRQKAGRIVVAGMTTDVTFEPVDGPIDDRVDDAYRRKYSGSEYMKPMIGARARSATVKVVPRVAGAARCPMGLRLPPTGSHPSCRAGETVHTDAVSGTRTSPRKESQ